MRFDLRLALAVAPLLAVQLAFAQQGGAPNPPNAKPGAGNAQQMTIDAVTLTLLIKGAVMALQQANVTGNYSVLRDMGTPVFREQFDQTALAMAFSNLRSRQINMAPAILLTPNLTKPPELNANGELVLVGDFPTQPLRIHFEFAFMRIDGIWRIAGIGVDALPTSPAQGQIPAAAAASAPQNESAKPTKPTKKSAK